jgi:hypothetical protein
MDTLFDSDYDLSKRFYGVRSIEHVKLLFYFCSFLWPDCQKMNVSIASWNIFFVDPKDLFCFIEQINEMTKELDTLLSYIEKGDGFRDVCITFQQGPLSMFEDGLQNFSELPQIFKAA